jgi:predicted SAM-dependent methyltransferase
MRLNLGSGHKSVRGYENLDYAPNLLLNIVLARAPFAKAILSATGLVKPEHMREWDKDVLYRDVRKIKYKPQSVELIYSSHFLEHVYFWEAQEILDKCFKLLQTGGIMRLALPDYKFGAEKFLADFRDNPLQASLEFQRSLASYPIEKPEHLFPLLSRFAHVHKWYPTKALVEDMLIRSGFDNPVFQNFQEGEFPELHYIETASEGTFYVEVTKS